MDSGPLAEVYHGDTRVQGGFLLTDVQGRFLLTDVVLSLGIGLAGT